MDLGWSRGAKMPHGREWYVDCSRTATYCVGANNTGEWTMDLRSDT